MYQLNMVTCNFACIASHHRSTRSDSFEFFSRQNLNVASAVPRSCASVHCFPISLRVCTAEYSQSCSGSYSQHCSILYIGVFQMHANFPAEASRECAGYNARRNNCSFGARYRSTRASHRECERTPCERAKQRRERSSECIGQRSSC